MDPTNAREVSSIHVRSTVATDEQKHEHHELLRAGFRGLTIFALADACRCEARVQYSIIALAFEWRRSQPPLLDLASGLRTNPDREVSIYTTA